MQLVIELPSREEQLAFNRRRWAEVAADPTLAALPYKIETNAHGNILMMPPASGGHSYRQSRIQRALEDTLGGFALPECPVSTIDGVRAQMSDGIPRRDFLKWMGKLLSKLRQRSASK